jgi:nucleoside-diphosphate-sugar epimerase
MGEAENRNPNVLITGGAGFLGKRIIEEIFATDSPLTPGVVKVFDLKQYDGELEDKIDFIKGDIRNFDEVNKACLNIDIVIHSAALIDW